MGVERSGQSAERWEARQRSMTQAWAQRLGSRREVATWSTQHRISSGLFLDQLNVAA
jgi:hypothetical protein